MKPKPSLIRIIQEGVSGECPLCGSSLYYRWGFILSLFNLGKTNKCIQPECENYYKQTKIEE